MRSQLHTHFAAKNAMKLNHTNFTAVISLLFILCTLPCFGQEPNFGELNNITSLTELASWLEKNPPVAVPLTGITGQRVLSQALTTLRQNVAQLRNYLRSNGSIGSKWEQVLLLNELQTAVNQQTPNLQTLENIQSRFHSHQWGLEITEIRKVAKGLNDYILLRNAIEESYDPSEGVKEATERLIKVLKKSNRPTFNATNEINIIINWLEENRQAPEICQTVRRLTGKYNFHVQISDKLVLKFLKRPIDQTQQVSEYVSGQTQTGRVRTVGETSGQFNPDPDKINLSVVLNGTITGNVFSQARNVTVSSSINNKISAVKNIYFDGNRLTTPPARANVQINSTITGINSAGGLVQSAATNRVYELKPQADADAAYRTRARIESSMNRELGDRITKANARFNQTAELYRSRGLYPDPFDCSTTEHALKFSALVSSGIPLIPHGVPEAPGNSDFFIAIHQSAIMESCKTMLADLKANHRVFMIIAQSMLPEEAYNELLKSSAQKKDNTEGSFYFNDQYPVSVQFTNNTIQFDIRIDAFQAKDSAEPQEIPMNLTTTYKIDKIDKNGLWFVRIKDPELIPRDFETETRKLTTQETTLRNRLQGELKNSFPESFQIKPRKLEEMSNNNNPDAVKLTGTIRPVSAKAANGWLTINWLLQE